MANTNEILTKIANDERNKLFSKSEYDPTEEYNSNHPNALSDGDNKGKGENGTIGSQADILARQDLLGKNSFNKQNSYSSSHPNALSDGDEPGKGETSTIGGKTDILTRGDNTNKNQFGPNNTYPNF